MNGSQRGNASERERERVPEPGARPTTHLLRDSRSLRGIFSSFATGVTVVTVGGDSPHAMTANSFTSVSLDPPLILVCVECDAAMHGSLLEVGSFGVSVLAADQQHVALLYANRWRPRDPTQFDRPGWARGAGTGAPLVRGALAWFECALWRAYDAGDHSIFVGRLLTAERHDRRDALIYHSGQFRGLPDRAPVE